MSVDKKIEKEIVEVANKEYDLGLGLEDIQLDLKEDLHLTQHEFEHLMSKLEIKYRVIIMDDELNNIRSLGDFVSFLQVDQELVAH